MCFSANASFTIGALLLLSAFFALKRAKPQQRMLAAIPLLFALQQFCEGFVWLGLLQNNYPIIAIYSYLFFVDIVWPLWVPLSVRYATTTPAEKRALRIPIIAGSAIVTITIISYFIFPPINASIEGHHIYYEISLPYWLQIVTSFIYVIATVIPFFIVRQRYFKLVGCALALSYLVSLFFFYQYHLSVWCFFAAFISIFIFFILG